MKNRKQKKLFKRLKILYKLKKIFLSLLVLKSLNACKTTEYVAIDTFKIWGEVICLDDQEKKVVNDKNLDYYLLHNKKLTGKMEGNCE